MAGEQKSYPIEWLLIPAQDIETAKLFYNKVFHFKISDYSKTFALFKTANISGALDSNLNPSRYSLSFSITVDNIPKILELIVRYGGKILKNKYSLGQNIGFSAEFADPNGNVLELYSDE